MSKSDEIAYETGASSHLDRMNLTRRLCEHLEGIFDTTGLQFEEYGQDRILAGNGSLLARLKRLDVKKSPVVCMTKFAPDYLILSNANDRLFLLDAKASITPMFFGAAIRNLQYKSKISTLTHHTVGEIEREAWDNYVNRFPKEKVAICLAAPYHPRLVVAEWASNLTALHRFEADLNTEAAGSGTPHVNVDLGSMRSLKDFLEQETSVKIDPTIYEIVLDDVKKWGLNKPFRVNWVVFNNVVMTMHHQCPWLRGRLPKDHANRETIELQLKMRGIGLDLF